ncbi:MAG: hypothetical protein RJQ21_08325 [Rhodospirillales bacterium]
MHEYKLYHSIDDFTGTDVFEFYPFGYWDGRTRWNPGSAFMREDDFVVYHDVFRRADIKLTWYGNDRVPLPKLPGLIAGIDAFSSRVIAASSLSDLTAVSHHILADAQTYPFVRLKLIRLSADLSGIVDLSIRRRCALWVLGL